MKKLLAFLLFSTFGALNTSANADIVSNVAVTGGGTAFAVGTAAFNSERAVIIGGSSNATILEFISLFFFDTTGLTTDLGNAVALGDIKGGTLDFTVNGAGGGVATPSRAIGSSSLTTTLPLESFC